MSRSMSDRRSFIRRVERLHLLLAIVVCAVVVPMWPDGRWLGLVAGAAIGGANFRVLAVLTAKMTRVDPAQQKIGSMLLVGKMPALLVAIGLVMWWLQPEPIAFVIGLSLAPIALVLVSAFASGFKAVGLDALEDEQGAANEVGR